MCNVLRNKQYITIIALILVLLYIDLSSYGGTCLVVLISLSLAESNNQMLVHHLHEV